MRKTQLFTAVIILAAVSLGAGEMMSVQVNSAQIKSRPSFAAPTLGVLSYADRVEVLEGARGWKKVQNTAGVSGWIHGSALSPKEIVLSSGGQVSSGASSEEVALAGKGFNSEIEQEYKLESELDFTWVDTMASWEIPYETLAAFLENGNLEGAQ